MPTKHVNITPAIAAWVRKQHGETPIAITDDGTVMWVACESGKTLALARGDYLDPDVLMPEPKGERKQEQPPPSPQKLTEDERWALAEARAGELVLAAKRNLMPVISRVRSERMQARWAEARAARKVRAWCMYGDIEVIKKEPWVKCTNTMLLLVIDGKECGLCMRHARLYIDKSYDRAAMWREPAKPPEPDIKF